MRTVPFSAVSRKLVKDPITEGLKELVALGLIRWADPHIGPDDWPPNLPLPIEFIEGEAIPTEE